MTDLDAYLERRIDKAALELQTAKTVNGRRAAAERLRRLVARRSAARVAEMEQDKGLVR